MMNSCGYPLAPATPLRACVHVPKGYIYAAMAFSAAVEALNMVQRNKRRKKAG